MRKFSTIKERGKVEGKASLEGPYLPIRYVCPLWCGGPGGTKEECRGCHCRKKASMLCSASSQMCGSWYLSRCLFREGSLALMNMASFMVLVTSWDSLSMTEKLFSLMGWPMVLEWPWMGRGSWMFLVPVPKGPSSLSNIFHCESQMGGHTCTGILPLLWWWCCPCH